MPEFGSAKTSSSVGESSGSSGSDSSSSSSGGVLTGCCPIPISSVLTATFEDLSGCPNIDGVVIDNLIWRGGGLWTGSGDCNGNSIAISLTCTADAWGVDIGMCGVTGITTPISENCDPLEVVFDVDWLSLPGGCACCTGTPQWRVTFTE